MVSTLGRALGWTACIAAVVLLVAALLLGARANATEPRITDATVRLPAVAGRPAAGYLTIHAGAVPITLVGAATPLAERIEFHTSAMAGGVMRMAALPQVGIRANHSGGFAPGGDHLMIFGLRRDVKPGATIPITLRMADGRTLRVEAVAVAAGAELPAAHGAH